VESYHAFIAPLVTVIMPIETQCYGMRGSAIEDPDGHFIACAEKGGA
jgi:uncharacterized glyoxalase superfamily protein PhnB